MGKLADQKTFHIIYKTTRFDGKYYIGRHSTDDLDDEYFGSGSYILSSLRKYGKEKHTREILEFLPNKDALIKREGEIVTPELLLDPLCMNLIPGGGGEAHNESTAERISIALTGKKLPEIVKEKIRIKNTGNEKCAVWKGKKLSEEHKANIGKGGLGRKDSDEARKNKSLGKMGVKQSETHRLNNANAQSKQFLLEYEDGRPSEIILNLNRFCRENKLVTSSLRTFSARNDFYKGFKVKRPNGDLLLVKQKMPNPQKTRCTVDGITIYSTRSALAAALGQGKHGTRSSTFRYVDGDPQPHKVKKKFYVDPNTQQKHFLAERPVGWLTPHEIKQVKKIVWNDGINNYLLNPDEVPAENDEHEHEHKTECETC